MPPFANTAIAWATAPGDAVLPAAWVAVAVLLTSGSMLGWLFHRQRPSPETRKTLLRIRTWWVIVAFLFAAMSFGAPGLAALFALVSLLALAEFVILDAAAPRRGLVWTILALGVVLVYVHSASPALQPHLAAPGLVVLCGIMTAALAAVTGSTRGALRSLAAFLLAACGPACVVLLAQWPAASPPNAPGVRLVFLLLLLTALNDVAQYLWGKGLGHRLIAPRISPRKTWAGLLGGVLTTASLAALLTPLFTTWAWSWGLLMGLLIGLGGVAGDLIASAYKRAVGAGDSGWLLPGHGGMIDRIDSLCVTAPLLYCAVSFL